MRPQFRRNEPQSRDSGASTLSHIQPAERTKTDTANHPRASRRGYLRVKCSRKAARPRECSARVASYLRIEERELEAGERN